MMKRYVVGFLFRNDCTEVALILKKRPQWQAGLINGIGGHVEEGESPLEAMKREFLEETGSPITKWQQFANIMGPGYNIDCFSSAEEAKTPLVSTTDEEVDWYLISDLPTLPIQDDLKWLIPLAYQADISRATICKI